MRTVSDRIGLAALAAATLAGVVAAQDPESGRQREVGRTYIGADYAYDYFHGDIDPWQLASVSVGNRCARGTFIGRVNYASRFATSGEQVEIDAYPRLSRSVYAYLNAGYSWSRIFPAWRSGGELFVALPNAWETSAGYRQLRFNGSPVTLLTGAVGKYIGNSWISARPYIRFKREGVSATVGLTARQYFADADNYVGARVTGGSSPSETADSSSITRNSAWSLDVHGSRSLVPLLVGTWVLGVQREQLSATKTRRRVEVSLGVRREF